MVYDVPESRAHVSGAWDCKAWAENSPEMKKILDY